MKPGKYKKRTLKPIVAVKLNLETSGFTYEKWGGKQRCKKGDWLVLNGRETYTIDSKSFSKTYKKLSPGIYLKKAPVWAYRVDKPGRIKTKEGYTKFRSGDWILANDRKFKDQYSMSDRKFKTLYIPIQAVS